MKTLEQAINNHINLGDLGFVNHERGESESDYAQKLEDSRNSLLRASAEVASACTWIQANFEQADKINQSTNSYSLKHYAEEEAGYISNGAFIAAALMCGYECQPCAPDSPNAYFNITSQKIKALKKFYYAR